MFYFLAFLFFCGVCHSEEFPFSNFSEEEVRDFLCGKLPVWDEMRVEYEFSWGYVGGIPNGYHIVRSELLEFHSGFYYASYTYHVIKEEEGDVVITDELFSDKACAIHYGKIEEDQFVYYQMTNDRLVFETIAKLSPEFARRYHACPEEERPYIEGAIIPSFVYGVRVNIEGKFEGKELLSIRVGSERNYVKKEDLEAFGLSMFSN